jgi:deoxycytidylate deaminase
LPNLDPSKLDGIEKPELVFGLVGAVGTPIDQVSRILEDNLKARRYEVQTLHLSSFMNGLALAKPLPQPGATAFDRINMLMDRGNELRQRTARGEALALLTAADINARRREEHPRHLEGRAFILRQLKHPDEVLWLRYVYGPAFFLVGIYSPENVRRDSLMREMDEEHANRLMKRDEAEEADWGQQLRRTFYLSDGFIEYPKLDAAGVQRATEACGRVFRLIFGEEIITPTRDEYGMYLAHAASLRSGDLSRQVGAAVLATTGEVKSLGCNEVPAPGGGQYWASDDNDTRDMKLKCDSNVLYTREAIKELFTRLEPGWDAGNAEMLNERMKRLRGTRIVNLTEFGRAVHAEMEAILAASRIGQSVRECHLFTTTFPCHNCAKHIAGAGVARVVYVEPYPKSLARNLHKDSIAFPEDHDRAGKTLFEPFVGISPRAYGALFSMITVEGKRLERKDANGDMVVGWGLRSKASPLSYIERESLAALEARKIGETMMGEE